MHTIRGDDLTASVGDGKNRVRRLGSREAAWGGGLFLIAERPGVSGDGDSRSTRPYSTAAPIKRNSALSDHPLSLSIGPSSTSLTRCHQRQITTIYFGEIGELRPAYIRPRRGTDSGTGAVIAIPLAFRPAAPRAFRRNCIPAPTSQRKHGWDASAQAVSTRSRVLIISTTNASGKCWRMR
jgi:hypothetical protein